MSAGASLQIEFSGTDLGQLRRASDWMKEQVAGYPGVIDMSDSFRGGKQEIELETVDDTGGRADGRIQAWVDGRQVFDRRELHVRDTDALRIETVWLNVYHGGKTPSPDDMHLLIDDVWIGRTRPAPGAAGEPGDADRNP